MAERINSALLQNLANNIAGEVADSEAIQELGKPIFLYEFDIVSGFVYISERGENSITTDPTNNRTNIMVQTSNEPIVAYWKDSFYGKLIDKELNYNGKTIPANQFGYKQFKVGKYYKTYLVNDTIDYSIGQSSINWSNNEYNAFVKNLDISLYVDNLDFNTFNKADIQKKLFLILDERVNGNQWLQIKSGQNIYNSMTNKVQGCVLTLSNLNLIFSTNAKDILTFVQLSQPGGNYAFPKENNGVVELDNTYITNLPGVSNVQVEFNAGVMTSSIRMIGRVKNNYLITHPKRLLLFTSEVSVPSSLQIYGTPTNNYFANYYFVNQMESFWSNWSTELEKYYNYLAKKEFGGGFDWVNGNNAANVRNTNSVSNPTGETPDEKGQYTNSSFSNWFFSPNEDYTFDLKESSQYVDGSIKLLKDSKYQIWDFFNLNASIYQPVYALPTDYKETTKWTLKDIPIFGGAIGGAVSWLIGFSPGWSQTQTYISSKPINAVIPCSTFEMGMIAVGGDANKFPYDVLTNDNNEFTATGNKLMVCSFNFKITDKFQTTNSKYIIEGAEINKGGNGIWDTKYLYQTHDEYGNWLGIGTLEKPLPLLEHSEMRAYASENSNYEIDYIDYKVIGKCDCRLTFYKNGITTDGSSVSVYETRHMTNSKFTGDGTLWTNSFKLNFMDQENNDMYVAWPQFPNAITPFGSIKINDSEIQIRKEILKSSNSEFPAYNCASLIDDGTISYLYAPNRLGVAVIDGERKAFCTSFFNMNAYNNSPLEDIPLKNFNLGNYILPTEYEQIEKIQINLSFGGRDYETQEKTLEINFQELLTKGSIEVQIVGDGQEYLYDSSLFSNFNNYLYKNFEGDGEVIDLWFSGSSAKDIIPHDKAIALGGIDFTGGIEEQNVIYNFNWNDNFYQQDSVVNFGDYDAYCFVRNKIFSEDSWFYYPIVANSFAWIKVEYNSTTQEINIYGRGGSLLGTMAIYGFLLSGKESIRQHLAAVGEQLDPEGNIEDYLSKTSPWGSKWEGNWDIKIQTKGKISSIYLIKFAVE